MTRRPLQPREGYGDLKVYSPGVTLPCAIDLSDNTNRWGIAPAAAEILRAFDPVDLTRYPTAYADELKQAIAERVGVDAGMIVTGTGSDGVLEPAIRAFSRPGDRMVVADPTFVMAAVFGRMNGLAPVHVPLLESYDADGDGMLAAGGRITYLCSPNNPTGSSFSREVVAAIVADAPGLVIIDEAYAEFAGASALDLALTSDRVLLIRTFSKAFGLAGLRVGYGIGSPGVVAAVEKARGPYTVSAVAERAAIAAARDRSGWMESRVADAVASRALLRDALVALGLEPAPSAANFVFVPIRSAVAIADRLAGEGIRVRAFSGVPQVSEALRDSGGEALRITVAPSEMLERALAALRNVIAAEVAR